MGAGVTSGIADGSLKPVIAKEFPLEKARFVQTEKKYLYQAEDQTKTGVFRISEETTPNITK